ncbi:MAG: hypothetical protein Q9195_006023 [Heterodermia aff. obscurata]
MFKKWVKELSVSEGTSEDTAALTTFLERQKLFEDALKDLRVIVAKLPAAAVTGPTPRTPLELLVAALLTVKRNDNPNLSILDLFNLPWNRGGRLESTSAKHVGIGMSHAICAIYLPETGQFVTGSVQPNLSHEILSLPVMYLGATMKFCDYLSQLRQQRFSDDEQIVINALVNSFLRYWQDQYDHYLEQSIKGLKKEHQRKNFEKKARQAATKDMENNNWENLPVSYFTTFSFSFRAFRLGCLAQISVQPSSVLMMIFLT